MHLLQDITDTSLGKVLKIGFLGMTNQLTLHGQWHFKVTEGTYDEIQKTLFIQREGADAVVFGTCLY